MSAQSAPAAVQPDEQDLSAAFVTLGHQSKYEKKAEKLEKKFEKKIEKLEKKIEKEEQKRLERETKKPEPEPEMARHPDPRIQVALQVNYSGQLSLKRLLHPPTQS